MSVPITVRSFRSEPNDNIQPGEFLKTFWRFTTYAHITENKRIIESFRDHLKYASPADEWFQELDITEPTWKKVKAVFLECFPPVERAKRTEMELEREFVDIIYMTLPSQW